MSVYHILIHEDFLGEIPIISIQIPLIFLRKSLGSFATLMLKLSPAEALT